MAEENQAAAAPAEGAAAAEPKKYAGKYESPEALEKAYLELQSQNSAAKAAEKAAEDRPALDAAREMLKQFGADSLSPEQQALIKQYGEQDKAATEEKKPDEGEKPKEGEEKNFGTKPEHKGLPEGTDFATYDFLVDKGMSHDQVRGYMGKMADGTFTKDDAKAIAEKLGMPEAVVMGYAQPRIAQKGDAKKGDEAPAQTPMTPEQYNNIVGIAGGQDGYAKLADWARKSLTAEEVNSFNAAIDSGDYQIVRAAVMGLKAMRDASTGSEPQRRIGDGGGAANLPGFENQAELAKAVADPRYETSEAYRNEVMARVARSRI